MNTSPEVSASSPFDNPSRFGGRAPDIAGASSAPESPFDSQPMLALHDKLTSWYDAEWNRQASNRFQQALDEDFYDGMQWTQEDAQALIERGQAPLVFNEVKPTIDWIIGTERRTRVDYKILPREKDDEALAEIKTKLMKYVSDANKLPWHRSMAFADAIKGGVGWLEVGIRSDGDAELPRWINHIRSTAVLQPRRSIIGPIEQLFSASWVDCCATITAKRLERLVSV